MKEHKTSNLGRILLYLVPSVVAEAVLFPSSQVYARNDITSRDLLDRTGIFFEDRSTFTVDSGKVAISGKDYVVEIAGKNPVRYFEDVIKLSLSSTRRLASNEQKSIEGTIKINN